MNAKLVYIQIGHLIPQNYARYTVYLYLMGLVNPGAAILWQWESLRNFCWMPEMNRIYFLGWRLRESDDDRSGKKHVGKPIIQISTYSSFTYTLAVSSGNLTIYFKSSQNLCRSLSLQIHKVSISIPNNLDPQVIDKPFLPTTSPFP